MEVAPIVGYVMQDVADAIKGPVSFGLNRFGDPGREIKISSSNVLPSACMSDPATARFLQPILQLEMTSWQSPTKTESTQLSYAQLMAAISAASEFWGMASGRQP